jgi:hypothetical protein
MNRNEKRKEHAANQIDERVGRESHFASEPSLPILKREKEKATPARSTSSRKTAQLAMPLH